MKPTVQEDWTVVPTKNLKLKVSRINGVGTDIF